MTPSEPKTVLYLTPSSKLLGARRSLLALADTLDSARWRPIVCGQSRGDLGHELAKHDIAFEVLKLGWWRKGKYFLRRPFAIRALAALVQSHKVDLIHCNEFYPNPYAVRARDIAEKKTGRRIPVVTHMRLTITERMIRNYDLRRAEAIAVVSEKAGEDFSPPA